MLTNLYSQNTFIISTLYVPEFKFIEVKYFGHSHHVMEMDSDPVSEPAHRYLSVAAKPHVSTEDFGHKRERLT